MFASKMFSGTVAAVALAFALSGPVQAVTLSSPDAPHTITFDTALVPQYFGVGEYQGVLHLTFGPDGTVSGWYRTSDLSAIRTVTGGLEGNKLWLNIGTGPLSQLNATVDGTSITGATYFGGQVYTFTATPQK